MEYEHIVHSFEPVYDKDSEILILGTLPSVKSRENNFYYVKAKTRPTRFTEADQRSEVGAIRD